MQTERSPSTTTLILATLALAACLWIGWAGFDPDVPQATVREAIHVAPRTVVQLLVQFVAPAALVVFLLRGLVARWRTRG